MNQKLGKNISLSCRECPKHPLCPRNEWTVAEHMKKSGTALMASPLFFFLRGLVKKIIRFKLGMGEGPIIFNAYGLLYDSVETSNLVKTLVYLIKMSIATLKYSP